MPVNVIANRKGCLKRVAAGCFSHVGLAAMVAGYSVMGGFLFQALEAPNESKEKVRIKNFKDDKVKEMEQLMLLYCYKNVDIVNVTETLYGILFQMQEQVTLAVKNNGWDGKDSTDVSSLQWSFAGALLYAVTVVTTIGYGHVAPKTVAGRIVTIFYALVGIPLTFLYLSNMGNAMAECFRLFYKKVCCVVCIYCGQPARQRRKNLEVLTTVRLEMATLDNHGFDCSDERDLNLTGTARRPGGREGGGQEEGGRDGGEGRNSPVAVRRHPARIRRGETEESPSTERLLNDEDSDRPRWTGYRNKRHLAAVPVRHDDNGDVIAMSVTSQPSVRFSRGNLTNVEETLSEGADNSTNNTRDPGNNKHGGACSNYTDKTVPSTGRTVGVNNKQWFDKSFQRSLPDRKDDDVTSGDKGEHYDPGRRIRKRRRPMRRYSLESGLTDRKSGATRRCHVIEDGRRRSGDKSRTKCRRFRDQSHGDRVLNNNINCDKDVNYSRDFTPAASVRDGLTNGGYRVNKIEDVDPELDSTKDGGSDRDIERNVCIRRSITYIRDPPNVSGDHPRTSSWRRKNTRDVGVGESMASLRQNGGLKSSSSTELLLDVNTGSTRNLWREVNPFHDRLKLDWPVPSSDGAGGGSGDAGEGGGRGGGVGEGGAAVSSRYTSRRKSTPATRRLSTLKANVENQVARRISMFDPSLLERKRSMFELVAKGGVEDTEVVYSDTIDTVDFSHGETDEPKVTVPISVCLIIIAAYIFAGSMLFTIWEDWDYITGSYFCFITLSTIGFGDIVPGTDMKEGSPHQKLILCSMWLVVGLSLLAMCFNLMQEEVKDKCIWLGRKLGLLKDDKF